MSNARSIQQSRMQDQNLFFKADWKNETGDNGELRERAFIRIEQKIQYWEWNFGLNISDSPVLPVVHGTSMDKAYRIAEGGFVALSTTDDGYYGKGIYFTTSANYTVPYFKQHEHPAIIICLVIPGNPYPVIEDPRNDSPIRGKAILLGYQSHYVVVTKSGMPFTINDYAENKERYDELVVEQEAQVLPIFILSVSEIKINDEEEIVEIFGRRESKVTDDEIKRFADNSTTEEDVPERNLILDNSSSSSSEDEVTITRKSIPLETLASLKDKTPRFSKRKSTEDEDKYTAWPTEPTE